MHVRREREGSHVRCPAPPELEQIHGPCSVGVGGVEWGARRGQQTTWYNHMPRTPGILLPRVKLAKLGGPNAATTAGAADEVV